MFINRNYFMKLVLLSTITFDIAFAEDDKESCRKSLQIYCNSKRPSNLICAKQAFFFYSINAEPKPLQSTQIFFAEVIFPNTEHRVLISPKDFCNIREIGIGGKLNSKGSSSSGGLFGKKVQPQPFEPTEDQNYLINFKEKMNDPNYLINFKEKMNDPNAVQQCLDELEEFIDFEKTQSEITMFEFAMLRKVHLKYKVDIMKYYWYWYMEYISKTISNVRVENEETDTPDNYCHKFDYKNGKRAIEKVNSQQLENLE